MSDDFTREELEAEIWRLRSAEIDVETLRVLVDSLQVKIKSLEDQVQVQHRQVKNDNQLKDQLREALDIERGHIKSWAEKYKVAEEQVKNFQKERDWALKKLEEVEYADHMFQTYGFEIPSQKKK